MELMPRKNSFFYSFENTPLKEIDRAQKKRIDYYPFGLEHQKADNTASSSNIGQQYKFNGVELENSTGLYEMDFRQYDPSLGRFTSVDPLAEERQWVSTYNFGQNNPVLRVDPSGLLDWVYNKDKDQYVWDADVTGADDVDLADNTEYVGLNKTDIDNHFEENNNWFTSTFGDPNISSKSFTNYIGNEMNKKIEKFIETGEAQRLDNIRGLYENSNKESHSGQIYFQFDLDININNERLTGGYGITHLFKNKHLNIIDGTSFSTQKFNREVAKIEFPYNVKFTSSRVRGRKPRAPIHIKIHKESVDTYNKLYNYKQ